MSLNQLWKYTRASLYILVYKIKNELSSKEMSLEMADKKNAYESEVWLGEA